MSLFYKKCSDAMISPSYLPIRPCIKMNLYLGIICDSSSVTVKKGKEPF